MFQIASNTPEILLSDAAVELRNSKISEQNLI